MKKLYIMNEEISREPMVCEDGPTMMNDNYSKEYIPGRQEMLKDYEINIRFLSVGCIVRVGCKEIPFTSVVEVMEELNKYVSNPYEETKRWNDIFNSVE